MWPSHHAEQAVPSPWVTPASLQAELQHVSVSPGCDEPEGAQPGRCVPGSPCLASLGCGLWAVDQEGFLGQLNCSPTLGSWHWAVPGSRK